MSLALVGSAAVARALEPLLTVYPVPVFVYDEPVPDALRLAALVEAHDAVWVVGDRRHSPRTVFPAPFLRRTAPLDAATGVPTGRAIPLSWLPDLGPEVLTRFALAARKVQLRQNRPPTVAILGQWTPQYLNLADRIQRMLLTSQLDHFRWTSECLIRRDLVRGLGVGLGLGIYVGHGRPTGWVGYRGTKIRHLEHIKGEPMGALISLTCHTANRRRVALTFSEAVATHGIAASALGAVGPTFHTDNARWAVGLAQALGAGCQTMGALIVAAAPALERAVSTYRLLGDPFAPLGAAPNCMVDGHRILGGSESIPAGAFDALPSPHSFHMGEIG